tara:strand:- start:21 stop:1184 length:1164 start_codon:yes stop_codon:yes gene_type:complete
LIKRDSVAMVLYARFPSEMAYSHHIIQVAKGFVENNCDVNIYYPKTYNKKTLKETPEEYYGDLTNVTFIQINNIDITSFRIYEISPNFVKKFLYSLNTFIWSRKLKKNKNENFVWSTNPNILLIAKKYFKYVIYEKHGQAKYIQKLSISILKKSTNTLMIGVTEFAHNELSKNFNNALYLTNGVDKNFISQKEKPLQSNLVTIGYIGMLETYGVDKGVLNSIKEIDKLSIETKLNIEVIGGPEHKLNELRGFIETSRDDKNYSVKPSIPHNEVAKVLRNFDIGIVPYPNDSHMNKYASPMKIFEMAACGVPILASDIKSHKELEKFNLGIIYFRNGDFSDFSLRLQELILDEDLRKKLTQLSLKNIGNLSWDNRMNTVLTSARSSTG